jgi:hypothetical protein
MKFTGAAHEAVANMGMISKIDYRHILHVCQGFILQKIKNDTMLKNPTGSINNDAQPLGRVFHSHLNSKYLHPS